MELVYKHLNHLKELNILDSGGRYNDFSIPVSFVNDFSSVIISLESFKFKPFDNFQANFVENLFKN